MLFNSEEQTYMGDGRLRRVTLFVCRRRRSVREEIGGGRFSSTGRPLGKKVSWGCENWGDADTVAERGLASGHYWVKAAFPSQLD